MFTAEHLRYDLPRLRQLLDDAKKGMTAPQPQPRGAAQAQA